MGKVKWLPERLDGETEREWEYFCAYVAMDPPRDVRRLARGLGVDEGYLRELAERWEWEVRAREADRRLVKELKRGLEVRKVKLLEEVVNALEEVVSQAGSLVERVMRAENPERALAGYAQVVKVLLEALSVLGVGEDVDREALERLFGHVAEL